MLAYNFI